MFAHVDARHARADRPEFAAILGRGVRLHIVRFHVRRPARQPDEDDRRLGRRRAALAGPQLPRHDIG
jgi:hypothetical protein